MRKSVLGGAILATAVALMFTGSAMAADSAPSPSAPANVKCIGGNACKGQSACKTASSGCTGQNSCKGKGYVMTTSAQQCEKKGGHVGKAD
ncbi:MAG: BufA2 family periplasmic bufferin-type metallophore [Candidatus Binataceae bacterium]